MKVHLEYSDTMAPTKSFVRDAFSDHPTDVLYKVCKLCPADVLKRNVKCGTIPGRLNSTNLTKHLENHHPKELKDMKLKN